MLNSSTAAIKGLNTLRGGENHLILSTTLGFLATHTGVSSEVGSIVRDTDWVSGAGGDWVSGSGGDWVSGAGSGDALSGAGKGSGVGCSKCRMADRKEEERVMSHERSEGGAGGVERGGEGVGVFFVFSLLMTSSTLSFSTPYLSTLILGSKGGGVVGKV